MADHRTHPGEGDDARARRRRLLILAICCMSLLMVSLDTTALNVALPSLQRDLSASLSGLQWTIDGYTVVLASFLLLAGSTADRLGRRRIFRVGLLVFVTGSVLCALAPTLEWLVACRVLQALGGSMLNPVAMSIITDTFRDRRELARAIGVWGGVVGLSMAIGPVLGGALVETLGWQAIFWLNLPIGLAALILTTRYIPESRAERPKRLDPVGQLLVIAALGALTFGIIEGGKAGWTSPPFLISVTLSVAALAALLSYEPRRAEPLLELRFFRSPPFSGAFVIAVVSFAGLGGFLFLNTLYLQNVRGLSPLEAGVFLLPMAGVTLIAAPLSGRLVGAFGPRPSLLVSGAAMTGSALLCAAWDAESSTPLLLFSYTLFGIGFGMVNAPITNTAVTGMPRAQSGVAAAIASTGRQIGMALGVAVIGTVLVTGSRTTGWWILVVTGALVLLLGAATTTARAQKTAHRVAGTF